MSITATSHCSDVITSARSFDGESHTILCFDDKYGISRVTLHRVPPAVADATAAAFNKAMAAHNAKEAS